MKRKTLTLTLCLLVCLSLIGVGFAAWIITRPADAPATGNIQVDSVTEETYSIETSWVGGKDSIVFGYKQEGSFTSPWLTNNNAKPENLTVTLRVTVKKDGTAVNVQPTYSAVIVEGTGKATWDQAVEDGYVTNPEVISIAQVEKEGTTTGEKETGVYDIVISANWGTTFEGQNPYKYYNSKEATEANMNAAKAALDRVAELENVTFKLTLHAAPSVTA